MWKFISNQYFLKIYTPLTFLIIMGLSKEKRERRTRHEIKNGRPWENGV